MTWTNDGLPLLINSQITEYDIKSGNTSIMHTYHLMPEETIRELEALEKDQRLIRVGLLMRENKEFSKALEASFNDAVNRFIDANDLDRDVDILAIRRDAVFVVNRPIRQTQFGEHLKFRPKNEYHAALQIGPRLEFYFKRNGQIDIKNFVQEDKDFGHALVKLKPGMLSFLQEFVDVAEGSNMDLRKVYAWIKEFAKYYKERELDVEYYREFTREALFRVNGFDGPTMMDIVPDDMIDDVDITFNYRNIIIPLLQIIV
jgi:hypothetical protein